MSGILSRLRGLSSAERRLVVEAIWALGIAAFAIALVRFQRIAAAAGRPCGTAMDEVGAAILARQVRWAIGACAKRVPWRAKCFEQGLASQWMLRRRQVAATLHYGVARRGDKELTAHVWVRAGPFDVIGCENSENFIELARFPAEP